MYRSIWQEFSEQQDFPALDGDRRCGVLIIGGGLAGILTAHFLKKAGADCLIAEGKRILSGVTAHTTAQITAQQELQYAKLFRTGAERAAKYLAANLRAVSDYKEIAGEIECDFEERDSYVYSLKDTRGIEEEIKALDALGYQSDFVNKLPLPLNIAGAYKFPKQAQFNPLKFARALAKNLDIYENTFVREVHGNTAVTDKGTITADKIIIATHFPFINRCGFYFAKMYQQRSYVLALEGGPDYNGMFADTDEYGMYFRNYKNYLLLGGGDHRTGKKGGAFAELREFAKFCYPDSPERFCWATQDCITLDGMPYIGRYAKTLPDAYVATGFNEFGMVGSMISARLLTEMIMEKTSDFAEVFDPARAPACKQLFANIGESVLNLINPYQKRCTHLGCALRWNPAEHSWDCPCHGSRFEENGKVIENPAMKDLEIL